MRTECVRAASRASCIITSGEWVRDAMWPPTQSVSNGKASSAPSASLVVERVWKPNVVGAGVIGLRPLSDLAECPTVVAGRQLRQRLVELVDGGSDLVGDRLELVDVEAVDRGSVGTEHPPRDVVGDAGEGHLHALAGVRPAPFHVRVIRAPQGVAD